MTKVITWETILEWWGKMLRKNEKKNVVSNEEKPVQSTRRLKNFLYKRFDFRYNRLTGVTEYRERALGEPPHANDGFKPLSDCAPQLFKNLRGFVEHLPHHFLEPC